MHFFILVKRTYSNGIPLGMIGDMLHNPMMYALLLMLFLIICNMMLLEYSRFKGPILWILDVGEKEHFSMSASMLSNHTVNGIILYRISGVISRLIVCLLEVK